MKVIFFLFVFFIISVHYSYQIKIIESDESHSDSDNMTVVQAWLDIENKLGHAASHFVNNLLYPILNENLKLTNVSSICKFSLEKLLIDFASLETWATQMFDASAKLPFTGLMEGSVSHLGRYDECLKVNKIITTVNQEIDVHGQYCSLIIRPPLPERPKFGTICNKINQLLNISSNEKMIGWLGRNAHYFYYVPIRVGLCLPSSCSPSEIQRVSDQLLSHLNLHGSLVGNTCDHASDINPNVLQIAIITVLAAFALMVIVATLVDINQLHLIKGLVAWSPANHSKETSKNDLNTSLSSSEPSIKLTRKPELLGFRIIRCFSLRRNASRLLSMSETSNDQLNHVHGIRVLTMAWIIVGHTFGLVNHTVYSQSFQSEELYTGFLFQGLLNATVSVDTFFFLSGLLTVYTNWSKVAAQRRVQPITHIVLRYIRLTPPYLFAISLAFIFPLLGSGPAWKETTLPVSQPCYTSWWTNLLYINNLVETENICLMHSWYLSNDFQFHVIGLVFMGIMIKSVAVGALFLATLMGSSIMISAVLVAINNYPPTIVSTSPATPERWNFILNFYYKPWPHVASYCFGLIFGYLLATKKKFKFSKIQSTFLTICCALSTFVALYGVYPWNIGQPVNLILAAIYAATFRTIWSANVGIVIFYLSRNKKGIFYKCLAWKGIIPLSRLTYMAYLLHPFVIWYHYGSVRETLTGSRYPMFHNFLAFYALTYICSFVTGLLFESPFINLVKLIIQSKTNNSTDLRDSQQYLKQSKSKLTSFVS